MSERFVYQFDEYDCEQMIYDSVEDITYHEAELEYVAHLLNKQTQRIAELEEQLKNAIVPKFKIGQVVYTFNKYQDCVYTLDLISIHIERYETSKFNSLVYRAKRLKDGFITGYQEEDLFTTKEEAQAKLEELQGD